MKRDFLPDDKQFLITKNVPSLRRADTYSLADAKEDLVEDDDGGLCSLLSFYVLLFGVVWCFGNLLDFSLSLVPFPNVNLSVCHHHLTLSIHSFLKLIHRGLAVHPRRCGSKC